MSSSMCTEDNIITITTIQYNIYWAAHSSKYSAHTVGH